MYMVCHLKHFKGDVHIIQALRQNCLRGNCFWIRDAGVVALTSLSCERISLERIQPVPKGAVTDVGSVWSTGLQV